MRVLHIEDEPTIARAIERMLRINYDATVVSVSSARAAIVLLQAADDQAADHDDPSLMFDLVISDFDLDGDTAADVVAWFRENDPDMLDQFFFLTGNDAAEAFGLPRLSKPAPNTEIRAMVEQRAMCLKQPK